MGITVDGYFGAQTQQAVIGFQCPVTWPLVIRRRR
jgi:hypothetical protein